MINQISYAADKIKNTWSYLETILPATYNELNRVVMELVTNNNNTMSTVLAAVYPVGAIYISANATSPATLFGGTWEQIKDRFLLSAGDSYTAGATGGEATHTLTESEKGSHFHGFGYHNNNNNGTFVSTGGTATSYPLKSGTTGAFWNGNGGGSFSGADVGNLNLITSLGVTDTPPSPHNNMPPYLVVYMWKRIA